MYLAFKGVLMAKSSYGIWRQILIQKAFLVTAELLLA